MATLAIKDLKSDMTLDHGAMTCVAGGFFAYAIQTIKPTTGASSTPGFWGGAPGSNDGGGDGPWSGLGDDSGGGFWGDFGSVIWR